MQSGMMRRAVGGNKGRAGVLALVVACGLAGASGAVPIGGAAGADASSRLLTRHPGVRVSMVEGRPAQFYGLAMNEAPTPDAAAAAWIRDYGDAFGVGPLDLSLLRAHDVSYGKFTVYRSQQRLGGLPVEFGSLVVLVRNMEGAVPGTITHKVVYTSGRLAATPEGGFAEDARTGESATAMVAALAEYESLEAWTKPELVVFFGEGDLPAWTTPVRAWKFTAEKYEPGSPKKFTFFVDAATGTLLHARDEILHLDVTGQVVGLATPGAAADHAGNPPVVRGLPEIKVLNQATGAFVYTDRNGNFTLPNAGTAAVNLVVSPTDGRWVRTNDSSGGPNISVTQSATPGTPVTVDLNPSSTEATNAQMNAFIHQTITHNFIKDRALGFTGLDTQLPANVMVAGNCNAFYNGASTNFYPLANGCNNTAFSSVVNHEYGHHIVNRLTLAQGAFGEGFGDSMSILINDDAVLGRFFSTNGGAVRNALTSTRTYPCNSTAVHNCGEVLANVCWRLREEMGTRYGSALGLDLTRQLWVDWAMMTNGGLGNESAHPQTVIEMLTVDDDNADLCDLTPNYTQITAAFASRNIFGPSLGLAVTGVNTPTLIAPAVPAPVTIRVTPCGATFDVAGSLMAFRINGGSEQTAPVVPASGANEYVAQIPGQACGASVAYSFRLASPQGQVLFPASGALNAIAGSGLQSLAAITFEVADAGWTVGPDTATTGNWERGNPQATAAQPEDDTTPGAGVNCWSTGLLAGTALGTFDVDNGQTALTSPAFNLAGQLGAAVSYNRWYSNGTGGAPFADVFRVQVSTNNGGTWSDAEVVGPASSPDTNPGWRAGGFSFASLGVTPSAQTRVRFIAEDAGTGSLVEAAVDDFSITSVFCTPVGCDSIDFNNDGVSPDSGDITDFLSVFGSGPCSTGNCNDIDFNNDGVSPDAVDLEALIRVFGGGSC